MTTPAFRLHMFHRFCTYHWTKKDNMFLSPNDVQSESLIMCSFLQGGPPNEASWIFIRGIAIIPKIHGPTLTWDKPTCFFKMAHLLHSIHGIYWHTKSQWNHHWLTVFPLICLSRMWQVGPVAPVGPGLAIFSARGGSRATPGSTDLGRGKKGGLSCVKWHIYYQKWALNRERREIVILSIIHAGLISRHWDCWWLKLETNKNQGFYMVLWIWRTYGLLKRICSKVQNPPGVQHLG